MLRTHLLVADNALSDHRGIFASFAEVLSSRIRPCRPSQRGHNSEHAGVGMPRNDTPTAVTRHEELAVTSRKHIHTKDLGLTPPRDPCCI